MPSYQRPPLTSTTTPGRPVGGPPIRASSRPVTVTVPPASRTRTGSSTRGHQSAGTSGQASSNRAMRASASSSTPRRGGVLAPGAKEGAGGGAGGGGPAGLGRQRPPGAADQPADRPLGQPQRV